MACKHEPEFYPDEIEDGEAVMIPCKSCKVSLMVRGRGDHSKIKKVINLSDDVSVNVPFCFSQQDFDLYKKHAHLYSPAKAKEMDKREIFFEMLADNDITIDQFNKFITRI